MAATVYRQPFGELNSSRMQGLISQKNCQNAVTDMLAMGPSSKQKPMQSFSTKRPAPLAFDDEDFDTENIDPSLMASAKRSMAKDGSKRPMFTLKTNVNGTASKSQFPLQQPYNKPVTSTSPLEHKITTGTPSGVTNTSAFTRPTATMSAPAGRSPKHKRIGILTKKRGSLSPFRRIDPPAYPVKASTASSINNSLALSIDAALSGTLPARAPVTPKHKRAPTSSLSKPQPKSWQFAIHEDTPDQHATNMMEHSACTLDISSDDEAGSSSRRLSDDRGKENVPPPGYVMPPRPCVSSAANGSNGPNARRSGLAVVEKEDVMAMIVEKTRAPLGALNAEDYYTQGLHKGSVHIVAGETEDAAAHDEGDADDEHEGETDENVKPKIVVAEDLAAGQQNI